ncbi:MAG TPA: metallophosphoesterase family protein [Bacteroidia bacterium]|nr:metallophosphoesterase family protein [Bacteroidia bacterium]
MRIALLSDTHGYIDDRIISYCRSCDEIWHAGDVGNADVIHTLEKTKPVRGVSGNIDGANVQSIFPKQNRFRCEDVDVLMIHIGGRPGNYFPEARKIIEKDPPKLFICGHSHILLVQYDKQYNMLHMNPGAAGMSGFHKMRTMLRFTIEGKNIKDAEVVELGRRGVSARD